MISEETRQKMIVVADACLRCGKCMKECLMLSRFAKNPKMLFTQYLQVGPENMDRQIAYSCNECSQCTLQCPKGLDLKVIFQSLKADYAAENHGVVPVSALLPSEHGQVRECAPQYCTALEAGTGSAGHKSPRYLFVPGKFPAQPILEHLQDALGRSNVALLSREHPMEAQLENLAPEALITACPSDYQHLTQTITKQRVLFYWDLMKTVIGVPREAQPAAAERRLSLHSPIAPDSSVHWVLDKLDCTWTEQEKRLDLTAADQDCRQILGLLFGRGAETGVGINS